MHTKRSRTRTRQEINFSRTILNTCSMIFKSEFVSSTLHHQHDDKHTVQVNLLAPREKIQPLGKHIHIIQTTSFPNTNRIDAKEHTNMVKVVVILIMFENGGSRKCLSKW